MFFLIGPNLNNVTLLHFTKGLLQGSGVQEQDGPLAGKPVNSRAGLTGLLMMKKKVSRWRANRLQSWALGGTSRANTKTVALENTYQMEPTDSHKFLPEVVERVAEKSIRRTLTPNKTYDPKQAALLTRLITEDIKASVKALNYKRYKFVVQVFLGQDMSQGVQLSSRCVWDTALDGQATAVVKSKDIFCVANIFATYFEWSKSAPLLWRHMTSKATWITENWLFVEQRVPTNNRKPAQIHITDTKGQ